MKKIINSTINFVDQINWHEVGQAIVKVVAFAYALGYCLGLWVHRTNAQLSAAHVAVLGLKPTAIVTAEPAKEPAKTEPAAALAVVQHPLIEIAAQLERLTVRELQEIIGTRQRLAKRQLISVYLQMA
jgi:hypothetical protein